MKCPYCGKQGKKLLRGFCTKAHWKLDKRQKVVVLECATCSRIVKRTPSRISKGGKVFCPRCAKNTGESHPRYKEGQYINPHGYRLILRKSEYILEHRHTWEQANLACLLPGLHGIVAIHHINMNKLDNRPQNLVLLRSEDHGRIHRFLDAERYDDAKCILMKQLKQQAFFLEHSEYLEDITNTSLQDILNTA